MIYVQSIIVFYIHLGTVERKDFHQLNYRGSFKGGMFMNGGAPVVFLCSGYLFSPSWGLLMVHCTRLSYECIREYEVIIHLVVSLFSQNINGV